MEHKILFTPTANMQLTTLEGKSVYQRISKTLQLLAINPHHPSLKTLEFTSLRGVNGEKAFEAYVQNNSPGAYRVFWQYGPDEVKGKKRVAVITVIAITRHP
jgi:hypothetical protein